MFRFCLQREQEVGALESGALSWSNGAHHCVLMCNRWNPLRRGQRQ